MAGERYHRVVTEEEAPSHGIEGIAESIGVTDKTREAMPLGQIDFAFGTVNYCLAEGDGEADRRVVNLIVIGIVIHKPPEIIRVQPEVLEEGFGQARFIIVSFRRLNGQFEGDWVKVCGRG